MGSVVQLPTKKVRLIHTSDIHLGDTSGHPQSANALASVVDSVVDQQGDVVLMVGDIFDNDRVSDEVLEYFLAQVGRLSVPVVVLPGNHDLVHETSVYRRTPFTKKPDNLRVIYSATGELVSFPGLGVDLWGRAMPMHSPEFRPLKGMPAPVDGRWLVGLAHGHFHFDEDRRPRSSPIYPEEVARAGCHYLGHWDRHGDVSCGDVTAVDSGCPLGLIGSPEAGMVTVVDLDPQVGVSYWQAALGADAPKPV